MSGKLIACVGGAGAPGVTTVASQLAHVFSKGRGLDTALVDMDMDGSPLAAIWRINDTGAMSKLYEMADIGAISEESLETAMQSASQHLKVVSGFRGTELGPTFRTELGIRVLAAIKGRTDVTVLDMGRPRFWSAFDLLREVDYICWVVTPTPEGAHAWRRIWAVFDGRGVPRRHMVTVLNQYNHPRALEHFPQDWLQRPGIPIVAKVPYLPKLESDDLAGSSGGRMPKHAFGDWSGAYDAFAARVSGGVPNYDFEAEGRRGLFSRLLGGR